MKSQIKNGLKVLNGYRWRLRAAGANPPRFSGAFPTRSAALASQPPATMLGYDNDAVTDVSFEAMCKVMPWDYPILFWLQRSLSGPTTLVDAGGHMGTKYLAFKSLMDLSAVDWVVYDLAAIVAAGKRKQAQGDLPTSLAFNDDLAACPAADILLASGLLQYLDQPLSELVGQMSAPPQFIFLNKVAMRDGPAVFTMEQIGPSKVPYQIRARSEFEAEIAEMGYRIVDQWAIPDLSHVIPTHPMLGASESRGYILQAG